MLNIKNIHAIYFVGIGGIGMSAIARYFNAKGKKVYGYDKTRTSLTQELEKENCTIFYEDNENSIIKNMDLVVYTPAIPSDSIILNYYNQFQNILFKRSAVLGLITQHAFTIAVAGTHGKTTTSTMIAHILKDSNYGCSAFLGGISSNYQTNFWSDKNNIVVVEADEYDRSFLTLHPDIAVITSTDPDHLDIYSSTESFKQGFIDFTKNIKNNGLLFLKNKALDLINNTTSTMLYDHTQCTQKNIIYPTNISIQNGTYNFSINHPTLNKEIFELNMGGLHNIENAVVAISVALELKIDIDKIKKAIANFKGVKRRFEYKIKTTNQILIDDYAHHPTELKALINGIKNLYPNEPFTLVFQPHLYSRTKDFKNEFAHVLSEATQLILLPIYPAREKPIDGVNSEMLLNKVSNPNKMLLDVNAFYDWVKLNKPKILVMAGAGDIDVVIEQTKIILQ